MDIGDPAGEWRRLAEHYRQLTDDELIGLARKRSELTEVAQQTLTDEIRSRRLKVDAEEEAHAARAVEPFVPDPEDSAYAEDRALVQLCTVWSVRDALQVQTLLDGAGIPFYMGPEKATGVDQVTSNFADGVSVQIMNVGVPWARSVMQEYFPKDEPASEKIEEAADVAIHCPKCHSEEVVFGHMQDEDADTPYPEKHQKIVQKYDWKCDSCGYEWQDDGVETK